MSEEHVAIMMFANFDAAMAARNAIAEQDAADVTEVNVDVRDDEAGPAESNFAIGNKRHDGKQTGEYAEQFKKPLIDGGVPIIAWCGSDEAAVRVKKHMRELGGRDVPG